MEQNNQTENTKQEIQISKKTIKSIKIIVLHLFLSYIIENIIFFIIIFIGLEGFGDDAFYYKYDGILGYYEYYSKYDKESLGRLFSDIAIDNSNKVLFLWAIIFIILRFRTNYTIKIK